MGTTITLLIISLVCVIICLATIMLVLILPSSKVQTLLKEKTVKKVPTNNKHGIKIEMEDNQAKTIYRVTHQDTTRYFEVEFLEPLKEITFTKENAEWKEVSWQLTELETAKGILSFLGINLPENLSQKELIAEIKGGAFSFNESKISCYNKYYYTTDDTVYPEFMRVCTEYVGAHKINIWSKGYYNHHASYRTSYRDTSWEKYTEEMKKRALYGLFEFTTEEKEMFFGYSF